VPRVKLPNGRAEGADLRGVWWQSLVGRKHGEFQQSLARNIKRLRLTHSVLSELKTGIHIRVPTLIVELLHDAMPPPQHRAVRHVSHGVSSTGKATHSPIPIIINFAVRLCLTGVNMDRRSG